MGAKGGRGVSEGTREGMGEKIGSLTNINSTDHTHTYLGSRRQYIKFISYTTINYIAL